MAGFGALQPVADRAANGRRCPEADIGFAGRLRSVRESTRAWLPLMAERASNHAELEGDHLLFDIGVAERVRDMACTRPYCGRCLGGAIRQKSPGSRVGLVARLKEATNAIGLLCLSAHQRL